MKKKRNPLLILLLVLAALLVVYAGVVVIGKNQEKSKQKEEEAKKIYVTDLGKLSEIQFDVGNGEIQLVKKTVHGTTRMTKIFRWLKAIRKRWKKHSGSLRQSESWKRGILWKHMVWRIRHIR